MPRAVSPKQDQMSLPRKKHRGWLWRLLTATRNPLVILLIVLAIISFATGDAHAGTVMSLMVILGVSLRFVQEARADAAAAKLKAMITLTTAVVRAGKAEEIALKELAPGDVVTLCAGDMIPADVRIISAKDLFVSQATPPENLCPWRNSIRARRGRKSRR
jgi:Mg2+-importing ATPase